MTSQILLDRDDIFGPWLCAKTDSLWLPGRGRTIGVKDDSTIRAAVLYEDFNGASVLMHVASDGTSKWLTRKFLFLAFAYPFLQLGVNVILAPIRSGNTECKRFVEHIGFQVHTNIHGAHPDGSLFLYSMYRAQCRWLDLKVPLHD